MKPIYSTSRRNGATFILAEHLDSYQEAVVAQAEFWAEGLRCEKEINEKEKLYYIWVGPERVRQVRTLSTETIRRKGSLKVRRRLEKVA